MKEKKSSMTVKNNKFMDTTRNLTEEFKVFISRGNVIELAIGLTVGVAFTSFVNSMVNNMFMPMISAVFNEKNFANLYVSLDGTDYESLEAAEEAGVAILKYGQFITDLINFLIIAIVVFAVIKTLNLFGRDIYDFSKTKGKKLTKPGRITKINKSKLDK